jgi:hypothetical protein
VVFSWSSAVSSINKTDCHDISEILLKVALNTIKQTKYANKNNLTSEKDLCILSFGRCGAFLQLEAQEHI